VENLVVCYRHGQYFKWIFRRVTFETDSGIDVLNKGIKVQSLISTPSWRLYEQDPSGLTPPLRARQVVGSQKMIQKTCCRFRLSSIFKWA
jgi:hypothetical protein